MKLITEIIDNLSGDKPNLENALIKTKVLLHRLGEPDLADWANKEIVGYDVEDEVPAYRRLKGRLRITVSDGYRIWENHVAVTSHLTKKERERLQGAELRNAISGIEDLVHGDGDTLIKEIAPEYWARLSEPLMNGVQVQRAWSELTKAQVLGVTSAVRSRLLDFLLRLEAKVPSNIQETEIAGLAPQIPAAELFSNAMFGDNATIIVGDHNTQSVNNSVVKNDLDSLLKFLGEKGVSTADVDALRLAVQSDEGSVDIAREEYGSAVKGWMKAMMKKAVDGTWQIGLGAAGSLLATALAKYYGFS